MAPRKMAENFLARLARERDDHLRAGERLAQLALQVDEPGPLLAAADSALSRSERVQDELRGWIELALGELS